jgi:phosphate transport system protein
MTRHFHRDLEKLQGEVLALSALAEEMVDCARRALCEGDGEIAEQVARMDEQVDRHEVLIEEECLKMLALHQPVAADLRRVAAVLKINHDLERIADLAVSIAQRAHHLHERPDFPIPPQTARMVELGILMVRDALNAFVDYDAGAAREVCRRDDEVDALNREIIAALILLMQHNPSLIGPGMQCFSAIRQVERIADHATNIAEDVVYLVEGEIIRHHRHPEKS